MFQPPIPLWVVGRFAATGFASALLQRVMCWQVCDQSMQARIKRECVFCAGVRVCKNLLCPALCVVLEIYVSVHMQCDCSNTWFLCACVVVAAVASEMPSVSHC